MQPVGLLVDSVQCSVCTMSPDPLVIIPKRTLSLPIELLSEVMAIAFTPKPSHTFLPEKPKEKFPLFSGFTQASKLFRQISLREWFRIIRVLKMVDFEYMASSSNFDFHASVREIFFETDAIMLQSPSTLRPFKSLQSLSCCIDVDELPFCHIPRSIRTLELRPSELVTAEVLSEVASRFPGLRALSVDYCSDGPTSTIPNIYESGATLGAAYGRALAPLVRLERLTLDLLLKATYINADHGESECPGTKCALCEAASQSHKDRTLAHHKDAVTVIAKSLPNLRIIQLAWPTNFHPASENEKRVCMEVQRGPGEVIKWTDSFVPYVIPYVTP